MDYTKQNYIELSQAVRSMKISGFKWVGGGWAEYKGREVDLTATAPNCLAIAYATLAQTT